MSGKKFELKKLIQYRRKQMGCLPPRSPEERNPYVYPVDWGEFNKLFFSKRNVIVEYPHQSQFAPLLLMGFYAGLKSAKDGHSIGMCNYGGRNAFPYAVDFANSISSKSSGDRMFFTYRILPEKIESADEWIMNADWSPKTPYIDNPTSDGSKIFDEIVRTRGFNHLNAEKKSNSRIIVGWEGKVERPKTKFVIAWDDRGKEGLEQVTKEYSDQFVVIPYTKEKRLVDEWFRKNDTMVDPGFDIQMMSPEINQRKVLLYAATNHLYDFRNFARVLPDVVKEFMSPKELKELM